MKNIFTILILLVAAHMTLSGQFISENKNTSGYYGIFGGSQMGISYEIYLNIGANSIEVTQQPILAGIANPALTLNGGGGDVNFGGAVNIDGRVNVGGQVNLGGELNRTNTLTADLLPYAYGTVLDEASDYRGSGNFTMDFNNSNYVIVTFSNSNVDVHEMSIVVTPKRALGQSNLATFPSYGYVVLPLSPVLPRNKFQVHLFDTNDNVSQSKLFSFIAYKL